MVGVQDENAVKRPREDGVHLIFLARDREAHAQEIGSIVEFVLGIDERLADRIFESHGGQRRHFRDHADRGDLALPRIVDVGRVVIEGGERADAGHHHRHWMSVAAETVKETVHLVVNHGVARDAVVEVGLLRGGRQLAIEQEVTGLEEIAVLGEIGAVDRIPEYIKRAKDPKDSFRLMGFGHRVYKHYDPRAKIMQKTCYEVLSELGIKDPLLDVAMELEKIALHDEYFIEKKLYPNVDFYSGITLRAMGFPTTMFTVLFALARTVGWIAQWKEMIEDPHQKLGRPRQLYTGAALREYLPMSKRK